MKDIIFALCNIFQHCSATYIARHILRVHLYLEHFVQAYQIGGSVNYLAIISGRALQNQHKV